MNNPNTKMFDTVSETFDMLIETLPRFKESNFYKELLSDYEKEDEERLYYLDISYFIEYTVFCLKQNNVEHFPDLFSMTEKILRETSCEDVETFIVIGFLEALQNHLGNNNVNYKKIEHFLQPKTKLYWLKVINFWEKGEIISKVD